MKDTQTSTKRELSSSLEDYLKEIYHLENQTEEVRVTDIARQLGISKPSVNRAIGSLKEMNLIEHEHYGCVVLTEEGREVAKGITDAYKTVYRFLTEILDIDEATAAAEAHRIEHDIGKTTRKKLKKLIKKLK